MIKFGFSAYLRVLCMKTAAQRRELRGRLSPTGRGYDFHRQMRALVSRRAEGAALDEVLREAQSITKSAERASAQRALTKFDEWSATRILSENIPHPITYVSPRQKFSVSFSPQFAVDSDFGVVPVHVWNTKTPMLEDGLVIAALYMAYSQYFEQNSPVGNVGILSIPESRLRMIPDPRAAAELSKVVVRNFETAISELEGGMGDIEDQPGLPRDRT